MESGLQSNEVRIPKGATATGASSMPYLSQYSSSSSISAILPASVTALNKSAGAAPEGVGRNSLPPANGTMGGGCGNGGDGSGSMQTTFDLNAPCQYFKSSFARSLSLSCNQTKSLDFGINFGLTRSTSPIKEEMHSPSSLAQQYQQQHESKLSSLMSNSFGRSNSPMSHSSQSSSNVNGLSPVNISRTSSAAGSCDSNGTHSNSNNISNGSANFNISGCSNSSNGSFAGSGTGVTTRNLWSTAAKQSSQRRSFDSTEIEVLRLRKECQNLVEENRRLVGLASGIVGGNLVVPGNSSNIEAVILQTQVDTLQWQLKQVEASRQMYRAVMEEVVRFLERCHRNLDAMQNGQIARSKSIHHVHQNNERDTSESNQSSPRARSSTNLVDSQKNYLSPKPSGDSTPPSPASSYNNFRDFTWRRSPKRPVPSPLATAECDPERLSQEAFRLLRTAQNLLNTQEPVLTQSKHALEMQYNHNTHHHQNAHHHNLQSSSVSNHHHNLSHNHIHGHSLSQTQADLKSKACDIDSDAFCMTFSRKMNMRESRLSLRSSTDDSVHSNSSSKNETDEEMNNHSPPIMKEMAACSTEDESGFSSISSFQEIGLPLSSTMISTVAHSNSSASDDSGECNVDTSVENDISRNSTLKASQSPLLAKVGLPLPHNHHRRWDSAPVVPPRAGLHHTFSTLPVNDDTPRVLWV